MATSVLTFMAWRRQENEAASSSPYQTQIEKIETEMKKESVCEQQTTNNCVMARSTAWQCKYGWVREKNAARRPIYL